MERTKTLTFTDATVTCEVAAPDVEDLFFSAGPLDKVMFTRRLLESMTPLDVVRITEYVAEVAEPGQTSGRMMAVCELAKQLAAKGEDDESHTRPPNRSPV